MRTDPTPTLRQQFTYYRRLGDRTFAQLTDEQLRWSPGPESNSIAVIVKHLHGNMLSRWTDFLTTDGEKESRNREAEFEADLYERQDILTAWDKGWNTLDHALSQVSTDNLGHIVYIRNQGHTVLEAIHRQLAHYAYHVGQIVYLGRMQRGTEWQSLSIPRGESAAYNAKQFGRPPRREHFTREFLDEATSTEPTPDGPSPE